jgi:hypothetical protein
LRVKWFARCRSRAGASFCFSRRSQNQTKTARDLLRTALALTDDLISQAKLPAAVIMGRKDGIARSQTRIGSFPSSGSSTQDARWGKTAQGAVTRLQPGRTRLRLQVPTPRPEPGPGREWPPCSCIAFFLSSSSLPSDFQPTSVYKLILKKDPKSPVPPMRSRANRAVYIILSCRPRTGEDDKRGEFQ